MTAMHRTLLKWFACCALGLLMLPARAYKVDMLPPPDPDDGLTFRVLCMNDVRDNLRASFADMPDQFAIETRTLTDLFEWIRVKGFNLISMQQIIDSRAGVRPLPPRPILLTFDDGYASTYTKVFPLLKKFNYPAVVAVVTSWTDAPAGTKIRLSPKIEVPHDFFMTWAQLREMAQSGLVELASHSHNLHRGVLANPQGNEQPAASSRQYLPASGRYENDAEYRARVRQDLKTSADLIREHTGVTIRSIVWPYGAHNRDTDQVAAEVGLNIGLTLQPGPNTPDVSLTQIRRSLVDYEVNVATVARAMREPVSYHGQVRPIERIVQVDLDYIYDPDPEQQNRNLGQLIDRMKDLAPSAVYLQAFAYPKGDGDITEVYFPNRHLPMRADLFNRVAWQLKTRAGVMVYAWLPVLTFSVPPGNPAYGKVVQSTTRKPGERGLGSPTRLSPFHPDAHRVISEIYEDLAKAAHFDGLLFHDDAVLDDTEDSSPEALATYQGWGLPPDIAAIRADPKLAQQWSKGKIRYLIDFTMHLRHIVSGYQNDRDMVVARNLYAQPVLDPVSEAWYGQSLPEFLKSYDFVALMAMPNMEGAARPEQWMRQLVAAVARQKGLDRTIFELQARDWRVGKPIDTEILRKQMVQLRSLGAINYGYYPDDFIANHPDAEVLRDVMSLKSTLEKRRLTKAQELSRQTTLYGSASQAEPTQR